MLYVDRPESLPEDEHLFGASGRVQTGSYDVRPLGRACIQAFFGGALARELVRQDALLAYALDELVGLFGTGIRKRLTGAAISDWASDRFSRGSYSHALVGCAGSRAKLASAIDNRLFFAGEATSPVFFSTAHGAYESGLRAAAEIARSLPASVCGFPRRHYVSHVSA
jgi:monoamine oxidase